MRRAMNEIGTSLAPPSNGFDEFSPTFSSDTKTQPTIALKGTFSQTVQCSIPAGLSELLRIGKQAERHDRDKDHHQKDRDRIIIARIGIVLDPLQRALHARKVVERARQYVSQYSLMSFLLYRSRMASYCRLRMRPPCRRDAP